MAGDRSCPNCKHYGPASAFLIAGPELARIACPRCLFEWQTCQQMGCPAPAIARFSWPGIGWRRSCDAHTRRAIEVAAAMGFPLPLDDIADAEPDTRANPRRCFACDAKLKVCHITRALSDGKRCCSDCRHPDPLSPADA
jgi:hypothetical protein